MSSTPVPSNWDRSGVVAPLNNMSVTGTPHDTWVLDSGTTSHMSSDDGILHLTPFRSPYHVMVGNSSSVPISRSHRTSIHTPSGSTFHLNNVLIVSSLAHNLISIRKFTRTTLVLSNLTPLVFSVKDLQTKSAILRCNSASDLYPFQPPQRGDVPSAFVSTIVPTSLWLRRLGHPDCEAIASLLPSSLISCNKVDHCTCHACQLGKARIFLAPVLMLGQARMPCVASLSISLLCVFAEHMVGLTIASEYWSQPRLTIDMACRSRE